MLPSALIWRGFSGFDLFSEARRTRHFNLAPCATPSIFYPIDRLDDRTRYAMALTLADVNRIAHLARIEIDATQAAEVHAKLVAIFAMINELQAVDTRGITPMAHAQDIGLPLRADVVTEPDLHELFQSVAPAVADSLYLVPRVVE